MENFGIKPLYSGWKFCHENTYELLSALKDKDLKFVPKESPKFQSLGFQFGCIVSTQQGFAHMLKNKKYVSDYWFTTKEKSFISVKEAQKALKNADLFLEREINKLKDNDTFEWKSGKSPVWRVISWLTEHERLHQGQLIAYFTLANLELPPNFKRLWNL